MFDKFLKSNPASSYYVGYRVYKNTVMNRISENNEIKSDIIINTYISDHLYIYTKKEDNTYYDTKLKQSVNNLDMKELCSLHLDSSNNDLKREDYTRYSKDKIYGVFGILNLEALINSINNIETLETLPVIKYDPKLGLTLLEVESYIKSVNKFLGAGADYLMGPMIKRDELDTYESDFDKVSDFLDKVHGLNSMQVKGFIKNINLNKKRDL